MAAHAGLDCFACPALMAAYAWLTCFASPAAEASDAILRPPFLARSGQRVCACSPPSPKKQPPLPRCFNQNARPCDPPLLPATTHTRKPPARQVLYDSSDSSQKIELYVNGWNSVTAFVPQYRVWPLFQQPGATFKYSCLTLQVRPAQ
eukprot:364786-Chlamydomonas_euryale.AAC.2